MKTLYLPYFEAKRLLEENDVTRLIESIPKDSVKCERYYTQKENDPLYLFQFNKDTEMSFPSIEIKNKERIYINSATAWNYVGDGTHCSEKIQVPFELVVGEKIKVACSTNSNMFTDLVVEVLKIDLARDMKTQEWSWIIDLKNIKL